MKRHTPLKSENKLCCCARAVEWSLTNGSTKSDSQAGIMVDTRLSRALHQMHRDLTNTFEAEKEVKPSGENEGKSNRLINAVRQSSRLLEITFMFAA